MRMFRSIALTMVLLSAATASADPTPFAKIGGDHPARAVPDKPNTDLSLPLSPAEARRRVDAYLGGQGFAANDASKSPTAVSYVRFGDRSGFEALADCHGPAVGAPLEGAPATCLGSGREPRPRGNPGNRERRGRRERGAVRRCASHV